LATPDSSELSEFLAQVLPELGRKVGPGSSAPFQEKADALRTLTWVYCKSLFCCARLIYFATLTLCLATGDKQLAKALVMRGHAKGKEVANELIGLLSSTEEEGHKKYATAPVSPTFPVTRRRACF